MNLKGGWLTWFRAIRSCPSSGADACPIHFAFSFIDTRAHFSAVLPKSAIGTTCMESYSMATGVAYCLFCILYCLDIRYNQVA